MNFDESIEYLYGLGNEVLAMKLGLENIRTLLSALGNPENNYLKIQIAGTNGKGSTVAFLESICVSAGIRVGATTSPHLVSITERIRINGEEINENEFARHATRIREISTKLVETSELETVPTYFEQVTAIALNAFAEARIELVILETGLGGRFDATTAAIAEIVAITPIDFDHQRILGDTLAEIAAEKAAIIRQDTKVILAPQKQEAELVILDKCREVGVEPICVSSDFFIKKYRFENNQPIIAINFSTENDIYHDIVLGLAGKHQITNAIVAVNLAEILREFGFQIEKESIWKGLEKARHKGRLEFTGKYLFDGAHNISGARALREFLDEFVEKPLVLIFGAMRDKNIPEICAILFPKARAIILTAPDNPRAMSGAELYEMVREDIEREKVTITENVEDALRSAEELAGQDGLILVTGSLYLIGEAQKILNNETEI